MVTSLPRAGVIGHPIEQSLSPHMHQRWMDAVGVSAAYEKIDGLGESEFPRIIRELINDGWLGINVTIPFKGLALEMGDDVTPEAKAIGAANFLSFKDGKIISDNTDARGFQRALETSGWAFNKGSALILGAGGAAPAIIYALHKMGVDDILVSNRTAQKAIELKDRFEYVSVVPWEQRDEILPDMDILVNATSLGMLGFPPLVLDVSKMKSDAVVVDIVTTPLVTPLIAAARSHGIKAMNGVPMLVYQGYPCFEAWFGNPPDDGPEAIAFLEEILRAKAEK